MAVDLGESCAYALLKIKCECIYCHYPGGAETDMHLFVDPLCVTVSWWDPVVALCAYLYGCVMHVYL